jgi:hypothetical protein
MLWRLGSKVSGSDNRKCEVHILALQKRYINITVTTCNLQSVQFNSVGDMLQDFDEKIRQNGINSAQITVQLAIFTIHIVFMIRGRERGKLYGE